MSPDLIDLLNDPIIRDWLSVSLFRSAIACLALCLLAMVWDIARNPHP